MDEQQAPVMAIDEAATYLRIPLGPGNKLAQRGGIPCQKVGRLWMFRRWFDAGSVLVVEGEQLRGE